MHSQSVNSRQRQSLVTSLFTRVLPFLFFCRFKTPGAGCQPRHCRMNYPRSAGFCTPSPGSLESSCPASISIVKSFGTLLSFDPVLGECARTSAYLVWNQSDALWQAVGKGAGSNRTKPLQAVTRPLIACNGRGCPPQTAVRGGGAGATSIPAGLDRLHR